MVTYYISFTEERQRAEGRGQKEENIIFALCLHGLKPLNLFMKKRKNMYFETRSAHIYYVPIESQLIYLWGFPSA
jgi:hypothetical protein